MPAPPHPNKLLKYAMPRCMMSMMSLYRRQSPKGDLVWNNTHFVFNDEEGCSWLCVFASPPNDYMTTIPRHRRIFIMTEPKSVTYHSFAYLDQFGIVISPYRRPLFYQGQWHRTHPHITWCKYGIVRPRFRRKRKTPYPPRWCDIKKPKKKTKLISVICSARRVTRFQAQRLRFTAALKQELGSQLDVYGRGSNFIADKADALDPYRYHIALENNQDKHFWTEKLAETYLGEAYLIHAGCKNLHDYFPKQSYTSINIFNIPQAIQQVKDIIASNLYEKNKTYILEAKRRVMEEHQTFPAIDRLVRASLQDDYESLSTPVPIKYNDGAGPFMERLRELYVTRDYWWRWRQNWRNYIKKTSTILTP